MSQWHGLPNELVLHVAELVMVATSSDSSTLPTQYANTNHIDMSLRAVDAQSRAAFYHVLKEKVAFFQLIRCPCSQQCYGCGFEDCSQYFANPNDLQLGNLYSNLATSASIISFVVSCPLNPKLENMAQVALFPVDTTSTLLLCAVLSRLEAFTLQMDIKSSASSLVSTVNNALTTISQCVVGPRIATPTQMENNAKIAISRLGNDQSRNIRNLAQVKLLLENYGRSLQSLLKEGVPVYHLVAISSERLRAYDVAIARTIHRHSISASEACYLGLLNLNEGCILLEGLSQYLLRRPLTTVGQQHFLLSKLYKHWAQLRKTLLTIESALVRKTLRFNSAIPNDAPENKEISKCLQILTPVFKARAMFYIAWSRVWNLQKKLVKSNSDRKLDVAPGLLRGNFNFMGPRMHLVWRAKQDIEHVEYRLLNVPETGEGFGRFDEKETLIWLAQARSMIGRIEAAIELDLSSDCDDTKKGAIAVNLLLEPMITTASTVYRLPYLADEEKLKEINDLIAKDDFKI